MSQPWPRDSNETASDQPGAVHCEISCCRATSTVRAKRSNSSGSSDSSSSFQVVLEEVAGDIGRAVKPVGVIDRPDRCGAHECDASSLPRPHRSAGYSRQYQPRGSWSACARRAPMSQAPPRLLSGSFIAPQPHERYPRTSRDYGQSEGLLWQSTPSAEVRFLALPVRSWARS